MEDLEWTYMNTSFCFQHTLRPSAAMKALDDTSDMAELMHVSSYLRCHPLPDAMAILTTLVKKQPFHSSSYYPAHAPSHAFQILTCQTLIISKQSIEIPWTLRPMQDYVQPPSRRVD